MDGRTMQTVFGKHSMTTFVAGVSPRPSNTDVSVLISLDLRQALHHQLMTDLTSMSSPR